MRTWLFWHPLRRSTAEIPTRTKFSRWVDASMRCAFFVESLTFSPRPFWVSECPPATLNKPFKIWCSTSLPRKFYSFKAEFYLFSERNPLLSIVKVQFLAWLSLLLSYHKAVVERRGFKPKIFDNPLNWRKHQHLIIQTRVRRRKKMN